MNSESIKQHPAVARAVENLLVHQRLKDQSMAPTPAELGMLEMRERLVCSAA